MDFRAILTPAVGLLIMSASISAYPCVERIYPGEIAGRNDWAEQWGYLMPGQAQTLTSQGYYVEFSAGCYRRATPGTCNPVIPVTMAAPYIAGLMPIEFCPMYDCYTPDQKILTDGSYVAIEDASTMHFKTVTALSSDASRGEMSFAEQAVEAFTNGDISDSIFVIEGDSGQSLEVTGGHPLIKSDGSIVRADTLKEGDVLAGANGEPVRLTSITIYSYEGTVWNVLPESTEKAHNILVVEGFLAGSIRFQEKWGDDSFRLFVRDRIDISGLVQGR